MNESKAREFLDAILAQPDEDAPRLIFADWLEEEGERDRAEFIRVQVERARLPEWDARRVRLRLRETALLEQHRRDWKRELPEIPGIIWGAFRRGFVATVASTNFKSLAENAEACWAETPIEAVAAVCWPHESESVDRIAPIAWLRELSILDRLTNRRGLHQLAEAPLLSTLRILDLANCSLGVEGFRGLLVSPYLGNLTTLRVPGNLISNDAMSALGCTTSLTSLTDLDVSEGAHDPFAEHPVIEASGMEALVGWPGLSRIRSLNLSGHQPDRNGLRVLLQSPFVGNLKELALRATGLQSEAMQEFSAARPELQLDLLALGENRVEDTGTRYLKQATCLGGLKVLELNECGLSKAGAGELARASFLAGLRRLNLSDNHIGVEGLPVLLDSVFSELHTLGLAETNLRDEGAAILAGSPAFDNVLDLDLSANALAGPAADALAETKYLRSLLILRLNSNRFDKPAEDRLTNSPLAKRLVELEMKWSLGLVPF